MILKAKYIGPFPEVTVPGFTKKRAVPGETVTLRVPDGFPIGGCWEIVEGMKEYQAALEKAEAERIAKNKERQDRAAGLLKKIEQPDETAHYLANGEADHTRKTKTRVGGAK